MINYIISKLFYYIGDVSSRIVHFKWFIHSKCIIFKWLAELYQWSMHISLKFDPDCKVWKKSDENGV